MLPEVGNIYSVYLDDESKYTAIQVIEALEEHKFLCLTLNYLEDIPINQNQAKNIQPLWQDHHSWEKELDFFVGQGNTPSNYTFIDQQLPLASFEGAQTGSSIFYMPSWFFYPVILLQKRWDNFPEAYKKRYKAAKYSNKKIIVGGCEHFPHHSRVSSQVMANVKSGAELDQLAQLTEIYIDTPSDWLLSYLKERPYLDCLIWSNHGQKNIDMRGTGLTFLSINATGLEELYLNDELTELNLIGEISRTLRIHAPKNHIQNLGVRGNLPQKPNLSTLYLHLSGASEINLEEVYHNFSTLKELRIWGVPAVISNIDQLSQFKKFEVI